jgi:hypothetical protein
MELFSWLCCAWVRSSKSRGRSWQSYDLDFSIFLKFRSLCECHKAEWSDFTYSNSNRIWHVHRSRLESFSYFIPWAFFVIFLPSIPLSVLHSRLISTEEARTVNNAHGGGSEEQGCDIVHRVHRMHHTGRVAARWIRQDSDIQHRADWHGQADSPCRADPRHPPPHLPAAENICNPICDSNTSWSVISSQVALEGQFSSRSLRVRLVLSCH